MKCQFCNSDSDYSNIGNHWRQSCGYPEPDHLTDVFDGLLMGDGCLKHNNNPSKRAGNQSIEITSINKRFIDFLHEEHSPFFTSPSIKTNAEECAKSAMDSDVVSSPKGSVFRTQYRIVSRAIPYFNRYDKWKTSGEKRWPDTIELTPTRLKYLYVADGGLSWNKESRSARSQITSSNEPEQINRIQSKLSNMGIECSTYSDRVMLKPSSTDQFLDYLGKPIPGFEYKWENSCLDRYENLYQKVYYREGHTYTV